VLKSSYILNKLLINSLNFSETCFVALGATANALYALGDRVSAGTRPMLLLYRAAQPFDAQKQRGIQQQLARTLAVELFPFRVCLVRGDGALSGRFRQWKGMERR
jgi:hypothetical protein